MEVVDAYTSRVVVSDTLSNHALTLCVFSNCFNYVVTPICARGPAWIFQAYGSLIPLLRLFHVQFAYSLITFVFLKG